jgi:hypothetical protein
MLGPMSSLTIYRAIENFFTDTTAFTSLFATHGTNNSFGIFNLTRLRSLRLFLFFLYLAAIFQVTLDTSPSNSYPTASRAINLLFINQLFGYRIRLDRANFSADRAFFAFGRTQST